MLQENDASPRATEPTMSALHRKNDTTNLFGYKLGELTEINKALIFFSGIRKQFSFFNLGIAMFENSAKI